MARTLRHEFTQRPMTDEERGMAQLSEDERARLRAAADAAPDIGALMKCVRPGCEHPLRQHVPVAEPLGGHPVRTCIVSGCECPDAVRPLHLAVTGPAAAGRFETASPEVTRRPESAQIREAMRRHPSGNPARPAAQMCIYQHAEHTSGTRAALTVAYIEAAAAGVHVHEYGPGGLARADNCPPGCATGSSR